MTEISKKKRRSKAYKKGRELALQVLYARDLSDQDPKDAWRECLANFFSTEGENPDTVAAAWFILGGFDADAKEIDWTVQRSSKRWRLVRMQPIDRNILRLGAFELLERVTPPRDVIYDCVELAKKYGDVKTPAFVNGILDQLCRDSDITL